MPTISVFYGIEIGMYYNDHGIPHFHAAYGEFEAKYSIDSLAVMEGQLPARAHRLLVEWGSSHQEELQENWLIAREGLRRLNRIRGLD